RANRTFHSFLTRRSSDLTATDECSSATVNVVSDVTTPGSCAGTYSRTITWDATDACANHSATTVSQTITVQDITAPTWVTAPGENATAHDSATATITAPT